MPSAVQGNPVAVEDNHLVDAPHGTELPCPDRVPVAVVLPDEGVVATRTRLAGQGAGRRSAEVHGGGVAGNGVGTVKGGTPELPRPYHAPVRVVFPDDYVIVPRVR